MALKSTKNVGLLSIGIVMGTKNCVVTVKKDSKIAKILKILYAKNALFALRVWSIMRI